MLESGGELPLHLLPVQIVHRTFPQPADVQGVIAVGVRKLPAPLVREVGRADALPRQVEGHLCERGLCRCLGRHVANEPEDRPLGVVSGRRGLDRRRGLIEPPPRASSMYSCAPRELGLWMNSGTPTIDDSTSLMLKWMVVR